MGGVEAIAIYMYMLRADLNERFACSQPLRMLARGVLVQHDSLGDDPPYTAARNSYRIALSDRGCYNIANIAQ